MCWHRAGRPSTPKWDKGSPGTAWCFRASVQHPSNQAGLDMELAEQQVPGSWQWCGIPQLWAVSSLGPWKQWCGVGVTAASWGSVLGWGRKWGAREGHPSTGWWNLCSQYSMQGWLKTWRSCFFINAAPRKALQPPFNSPYLVVN